MNFQEHDIVFRIGSPDVVGRMAGLPAFRPFEEPVLDFLGALSKRLIGVRSYPDVATFGFWCRPGSLLGYRKRYEADGLRLGRGVVFHSTPSNVPVNFAYSFAAGMLAGNANIVRLPAKGFGQVGIICDAVEDCLDETMRPYVAMVGYGHSPELNAAFSALCDGRVVWGGDDTVARMRQAPLPPRAVELTFADRYSVAVVDADGYLALPDRDRVAQGFYDDTYLSDQNACTSPRLVFWIGSRKREAQADFWSRLGNLVRGRYDIAPVQTVAKLHAACLLAAGRPAVVHPSGDWALTRVRVGTLTADLMDLRCHSGFFMEYDAESLDELAPVLRLPCQTLTYCGVNPSDVRAMLLRVRPRGVDRVVPFGHAMDFDLVWDGVDLIRALSREVGGVYPFNMT